MSKGFKGFLIGLLILIVLFVLVVLIWGSIKNLSFIEVIKSWFVKPSAPLENTSPIASILKNILI